MVMIKQIGSSGQISLGKEYAGRNVLVDEIEPGTWIIKCGTFIPDSERWLHEPSVSAKIDRGLEWASKTPPKESDISDIIKKMK